MRQVLRYRVLLNRDRKKMTRLRDREADTDAIPTAVLLRVHEEVVVSWLRRISRREDRLKIQDSWLLIKVKVSQSR